MNIIVKNIKNSDGSIDKIMAKSYDNTKLSIGSNYKLIKFSESKKTFKDTLLGSDIGVHSTGFINISIISILITLCLFMSMLISFQI